ncbi:MAG: serine/threonine protein kinase [Thermoanaerobaculia bacterium]|nr:MAG: serine/threonine protein kinase [Thermoanaerobaculia bacterium]MBZ0102880.1 serine/threonine protein kinase [Thermoanaerobaculia bacterium]
MSAVLSWDRLRDELDRLLALDEAGRLAELERLESTEPQLARELRELVDAAGEVATFDRPVLERMRETAAAPEPPPETIGPWRLEAEIGRGGMGSVWRARRADGAFERTVAVKLVRSELSSDLLRRHLARERRILARLAHPAIARLLDGGTTDAGVPYLVLDHVEGERIDAWCDARALPLAARLRLFVEVCGAVAFAHRQLVLHRDLKTANILVDREGRVKLLDFGIAKLLEADEADGEWTALGLPRPLTPGWASPEQLRGEPLTTASDVYSLGVLLCVLTAGRSPHPVERTSSHAEQAKRIEAAGRVRLPTLAAAGAAPGVDRQRLTGDLERIAAKALEPEPAARYRSVGALAEDVERFLAGRPVEAHPPALAYRLAKFVRRHALTVSATSLAVVLLVASGLVSLAQASRARLEAERAARRLTEVRELAGSFLFEMETGLRELAGSTKLREQVVTTALRYLELLSAEAADDPALLEDLARGYVKVAEIQGSPFEPNLGQPEAALTSAERAIASASRLVELQSDERAGHERLSFALRLRGDVEATFGRATAARESYRLGLESARRAAATDPGDLELRRVAASLLQRMASTDQTLGRLDDAIRALEESLAEFRRLAAADPARFERSVLVAHALLGQALLTTERTPEALAAQRAALAIAERRLAAAPDRPETIGDWTAVADRTIVALLGAGEPEEAQRLAERSLDLRRRQVAADAANVEARFDLGTAWYWLGMTATESADLDAAADAFTESVRVFEPLTVLRPDNVVDLQALVSSRGQLADVERQRGRRAEAHAQFTAARRDLDRLIALAPEGTDFDLQKQIFAEGLAATGRPAP